MSVEKGLEVLQKQYDDFYYSMLRNSNREIFEFSELIAVMTQLKEYLIANKSNTFAKVVLINLATGEITLDGISQRFLDDAKSNLADTIASFCETLI